MRVRAVARSIRMSPRKVRLVTDAVKGMKVADALAALSFLPKAAAVPVAKVVKSAASNAENNFQLDPDDLYIAHIVADPGPTLKRFRPKARGRVGRILKRSTHITVEVEERESTVGA